MIVRRVATALLATSIAALLAAGPAHAETRDSVRALASANLDKQTCGTNSLGGVGYQDSCRMKWAWCSEFARWVWGNNGLKTDRLNAESGSFYLYGERNGTLHADGGYVPRVGDAVVFNYQGNGNADHVALVDAVNADGSIRTINGNFGGTNNVNSSVKYATGPGRVGQTLAGQRISAFVSPVGLSDPVRAAVGRIGVRFDSSAVSVKEGNLYDSWVTEHNGGIVKSDVDGDMIGVLTSGGDLYVKHGNLYENWYLQAGNVRDFALESAKGRIGIVRTDGTVAVKEGGVQGGWVEEAGNAREIELSGDYLGFVGNDNKVYVKQGNLYESWTTQLGDAANLEMDASTGRIAVVRQDGSLTVKDGGLYGSWVEQIGGVKDVDLSGDYLGVVLNDGTATVKVGNLYATWVNQLGGAKDIEVDAKTGRIGVLRANGDLAVKDGGPYGSWVEQAGGVAEFQLTNY